MSQFFQKLNWKYTFSGASLVVEVKASARNAGDPGSIPGLGISSREGNGNTLPVFLPRESHGRRSLVGYNPRGRKESDMTERLHFTSLHTFSEQLNTMLLCFKRIGKCNVHKYVWHLLSNASFSSVQSLSHVQLFAIPWTAAHQASLSITNSWSSPTLMSIESVMPSNHFILCHLLLLLPLIFPSIRVFSNALHIRWPKYCSFSFNIRPSNEHSGLISFRMDWLDLLAVQGTLKSFL